MLVFTANVTSGDSQPVCSR